MPEGLFVSGARQRRRSEIEDRSLRAATGLRDLGVAPGMPVAMLLRNDFAFIEATFAVEALGGCAVPVNWHLAAPEVAYVIRDCAAPVLIVHADLLHLLGSAVPDHVSVLVVETPPEIAEAYGLADAQCAVPQGLEKWDDWLDAQRSKVLAGCAAINARWMAHLHGPLDMSHIAVGCALGYLDLRHGDRDWRKGRDVLAAWEARFAERDAMRATVPPA